MAKFDLLLKFRTRTKKFLKIGQRMAENEQCAKPALLKWSDFSSVLAVSPTPPAVQSTSHGCGI
ncbi:MAG: hypothetical protein AAF531_23660, partial [Actinomycetota bacterium]